MSYLLDTNVLSELRRKQTDPGVANWFAARAPMTLYLSALTMGEIRSGIAGATPPARRQALSDWLETDLPAYFAGRTLPVDGAVAQRWGRLLADAGRH